jgi:hypothetical protein
VSLQLLLLLHLLDFLAGRAAPSIDAVAALGPIIALWVHAYIFTTFMVSSSRFVPGLVSIFHDSMRFLGVAIIEFFATLPMGNNFSDHCADFQLPTEVIPSDCSILEFGTEQT